jgi:hypothetical protein
VALVITDVSEEPGASFIKVTKIGELGTTQAATSNRRTLRSFFAAVSAYVEQPDNSHGRSAMQYREYSMLQTYGASIQTLHKATVASSPQAGGPLIRPYISHVLVIWSGSS